MPHKWCSHPNADLHSFAKGQECCHTRAGAPNISGLVKMWSDVGCGPSCGVFRAVGLYDIPRVRVACGADAVHRPIAGLQWDRVTRSKQHRASPMPGNGRGCRSGAQCRCIMTAYGYFSLYAPCPVVNCRTRCQYLISSNWPAH